MVLVEYRSLWQPPWLALGIVNHRVAEVPQSSQTACWKQTWQGSLLVRGKLLSSLQAHWAKPSVEGMVALYYLGLHPAWAHQRRLPHHVILNWLSKTAGFPFSDNQPTAIQHWLCSKLRNTPIYLFSTLFPGLRHYREKSSEMPCISSCSFYYPNPSTD